MSRKDSIDTLVGLLNLLSDPEVTKKRLAELEQKTEAHRNAIKEHRQAEKDAEAKIAMADGQRASIEAESIALADARSKLESERHLHLAAVTKHNDAVRAHENSVREFKTAQIQADRDHAERMAKHDTHVAEQLKKLNDLQNELLRRDKSVAAREEALAIREQDLREIQEQARQLAVRTTRR